MIYIFNDYDSFVIIANNKLGNIGICAIFLAIVSCMILYKVFYEKMQLLKRFSFLITVCICIYVIFISKCRSAYLVLVVYSIFAIWDMKTNKDYTCNKKYRIALFSLAFIILITGIVFTFFDEVKAKSVIGRNFILQNCIKMFCDKPFLGHGGLGIFATKYPLYQAQWFCAHNSINEDYLLADNVIYANNEYIQTLCETGMLGELIIGAMIFYLIFSLNKNPFLLRCTLIPLLFASAFYYTLHTTLFCSIALVICIIASYYCKRVFTITRSKSKIIYGMIIIFSILMISYDIHHYTMAKKVYAKISSKKITYKQANNILKFYNENHKFIALISTAYTDTIGDIYDKVEENFLNSDMLWLEARELLRAGQDSLAEHKLLLASRIVPNRFRYPYELMLYYRKQGEYKKCLLMAAKIQKMPVKIQSPIVTAIKIEANNVLKGNSF